MIFLPSGEKRGKNSCRSGVLVMFLISEPSGRIRYRSACPASSSGSRRPASTSCE